MFVKADLDDDGFVTVDDFYNIMTHRVYWEQWKIHFDLHKMIFKNPLLRKIVWYNSVQMYK